MTKPIQIKNLTIGAGIPKICVPLTGTTEEKICQEAKDAKKAGADLVEWRADFFEGLMDKEACKQVLGKLSEILGETPLLFTIRTSEEAEILPFPWKITVHAAKTPPKAGRQTLWMWR